MTAAEPGSCTACGGEMVAGGVVLPIVGPARFAYHMGSATIETEIDGAMCTSCGAVVFRGRDPGRIRRAHESLRRARGG